MPFLHKIILKHKIEKRQGQTSLTAGKYTGTPNTVFRKRSAKRVFSSSFPGSLTIEAAMVLPLFLFAVTCFLQFFLVMKVQLQVENAMIQTAKELSQYAYVYEQIDTGKYPALDEMIRGGLSPAYVKSQIAASLKEGQVPEAVLAGEISFWESSFLEDGETIALNGNYKIRFFYNLFSIPDYQIKQGIKVQAWLGRSGRDGLSREESADERVYVTPSGTVYHTSDSCSHIKLSIERAVYSQIGGLRNQSGGKYYACERCIGKGEAAGQIYITETGTRYHNSSSCSGLKRSISSISITEAGDRKLCSRCGSSL